MIQFVCQKFLLHTNIAVTEHVQSAFRNELRQILKIFNILVNITIAIFRVNVYREL
jgi:hypothetical protein